VINWLKYVWAGGWGGSWIWRHKSHISQPLLVLRAAYILRIFGLLRDAISKRTLLHGISQQVTFPLDCVLPMVL
jgi:hypothetical protein